MDGHKGDAAVFEDLRDLDGLLLSFRKALPDLRGDRDGDRPAEFREDLPDEPALI